MTAGVFLSYNNFFVHDEFSEWWNRHFRQLRNQHFCCPTMMHSLLKIFFKIISVSFTLCWWYQCNFLEKEKKVSYLNIHFYHYQRFSKISKKKWEILKSAECHKRCVQMYNSFRLIVTNTLNFHLFWRIRST